jgi:hypothetical protein
MTDPQLEALAVLRDAAADGDGRVLTSRTTVGGFIATRVANALIELGFARAEGSFVVATEAGLAAYIQAMTP